MFSFIFAKRSYCWKKRHNINPDVKSLIFSFLNNEDIRNINRVDKTLKSEADMFDYNRQVIARVYQKNGSFKNFFGDPRSLAVRFIAEQNNMSLTKKFMKEFFNSQPNIELIILWLNHAPTEMFNDWNFFMNRALPKIIERSNFIESIRVFETIATMHEGGFVTGRTRNWLSSSEMNYFRKYFSSKNDTLKLRARKAFAAIKGDTDCKEALDYWKESKLI